MKRIGTFIPLSSLRSRRADLAHERSGTFATALVFVDWLRRTRQHVWQLLPLAQTHLEPGSRSKRVPSPYKGYGIGLDPRYLAAPWSKIDPTADQLHKFVASHADWIHDYALFCALSDRFGTDDWTAWDAAIRKRDPAALKKWSLKLSGEIGRHILMQWRLHAALAALKARAKRSGIRLIGDLPFYLPLRSPLVWRYQRAFDLDPRGKMRRVSGVPEGPRAHYGRQLWGHPLYSWNKAGAEKRLVELWKIRLAHAAEIYDFARLDHAKGLYNFGAMAPDKKIGDRIVAGPGSRVLVKLLAFCRQRGLGLYAEDAGDRLAELRAALKKHRVPGIRILRYAYNEKRKKVEPDYAHPSRYPRTAFAFTTTHDTVTLLSYVKLLNAAERRLLAAEVGIRPSAAAKKFAADLRGALLGSSAATVVIPIQDWLLTEDRINVPGTEKKVGDRNWRYRMDVPIERLPKKLPFKTR